MKRKSIYQIMYPITLVLLVLFTISTHSQEKSDTNRNKSVFIEFLGSGATIITANFDIRFNKGRTDGLGMRIGVGGGSVSENYIIGEGSTKTKTFTVPLEVNYIFGKRKFSFEIGGSITYVSISEDSNFQLFGMYTEEHESENVIVSYIPIGFRLKPENNGFMLKINIGPILNFSGPNLVSDETISFWGGLAIGYSFF